MSTDTTAALSAYIATMQAQHGHTPAVRDGKLLDQRDEDRFSGWRLRGEAAQDKRQAWAWRGVYKPLLEAGAELLGWREVAPRPHADRPRPGAGNAVRALRMIREVAARVADRGDMLALYEAHAALSAAPAAPVAGLSANWRPIESAPDDIRIICAWLGAPGCSEVGVACRFTDHHEGAPYWCNPEGRLERYGVPHLWQPFPTIADEALPAALAATQPAAAREDH